MPRSGSQPPPDPLDDLGQLDPELHITARPGPRFWRGLWEYACEVVALAEQEAMGVDQVGDPTGDDPPDETAELVELQRRRDETTIAVYHGRAS